MVLEHEKEGKKLAMRIDSVIKQFLKEETQHEAFLAMYRELVNHSKERAEKGMAI